MKYTDDTERWRMIGVHNTTIVEVPCEIGYATNIWAFAHVSRGAVIGPNCMIGEGVHIGPNVEVGRGCKIQNGAQLFEGVVLEHDVFIGPHVVFTNVLTPRAAVNRRGAYHRTVVRQGASIGANATILCGITIGEYAMIGAGAVVTKDIYAHAIVVGNPAHLIGWACECGLRLTVPAGSSARVAPSAHACETCGAQYIAPMGGGLTRAP